MRRDTTFQFGLPQFNGAMRAIILLTLGIFALVVNGLMLWLLSSVSSSLGLGFHVSGFWSAFFGALVVSIVSALLSLSVRPKAHYARPIPRV